MKNALVVLHAAADTLGKCQFVVDMSVLAVFALRFGFST